MGMFGKPTNLNLTPVTKEEAPMLTMGKRDSNEFDRGDFGPSSSSSEPAKSSGGVGEKTIIGEHISIEGTIRANEDMVVEGNVKGTIEVKAHQLTVGPKGKVEADVDADSVVVSGRMIGNITAKNKVQVTKNADFSGQIKAKRIAVEDGAFVKASIELEKDDKPQQATPPQKTHGGSTPASSIGEQAKTQKPAEFAKI
jgi:cytoskeletal protein CcmA (bactofilin family)